VDTGDAGFVAGGVLTIAETTVVGVMTVFVTLGWMLPEMGLAATCCADGGLETAGAGAGAAPPGGLTLMPVVSRQNFSAAGRTWSGSVSNCSTLEKGHTECNVYAASTQNAVEGGSVDGLEVGDSATAGGLRDGTVGRRSDRADETRPSARRHRVTDCLSPHGRHKAQNDESELHPVAA
jgi:hypothetical protein